jgi:hypothetical protein
MISIAFQYVHNLTSCDALNCVYSPLKPVNIKRIPLKNNYSFMRFVRNISIPYLDAAAFFIWSDNHILIEIAFGRFVDEFMNNAQSWRYVLDNKSF